MARLRLEGRNIEFGGDLDDPKVVKERRIHDEKQILLPDQIKIGKLYAEVYTHLKGRDRTNIHRIISIDPVERYVKATWILPNGEEIEDGFYLADVGVIPYENGLWNATNYLIQVEATSETKEE